MTTEEDVRQLWAQIEELKAQPEPQLPKGLRWMDKMSAPESPWTMRILMTFMAITYALGFSDGSFWFAACFGIAMFAWPVAEDRSKFKREQRMAKYRKDMEEWEAAFRAAHRIARERALHRQRHPPVAVSNVLVGLVFIAVRSGQLIRRALP